MFGSVFRLIILQVLSSMSGLSILVRSSFAALTLFGARRAALSGSSTCSNGWGRRGRTRCRTETVMVISTPKRFLVATLVMPSRVRRERRRWVSAVRWRGRTGPCWRQSRSRYHVTEWPYRCDPCAAAATGTSRDPALDVSSATMRHIELFYSL